VTAIHGIDETMVIKRPRIRAVLPDLLLFIERTVLVAHNAAFDMGFLRAALMSSGLGDVRNIILDSCDLAKRAFPGKKSYSLQKLAADLALKSGEAHRALDDARLCMQLFMRSVDELSFMGQLQLNEILV
jgi:DNA polymerase III epsilon subunit family exonuclease